MSLSNDPDYASNDEESDFEETDSSTFLGFVDVAISEEEQPDLDDTFIGGQPIWLNPDSPPPSELLMCKNCSSPMHLLLQCSANLENTFYDRVIYLFGCNKPGCRRKDGSVRAIRALCKDPALMKEREDQLKDYLKKQEEKKKKIEEKQKQNAKLTQDLFTVAAKPTSETSGSASTNPFGSASSNPFGSESSSNPFAANPFDSKPQKEEDAKPTKTTKPTYADIAKPTDSQTPKKAASRKLDIKLPAYPGYIVYIDQEVLDPKKQQLPPLPTTTATNADTSPEQSSSSKKSSNESKENDELAKMLDDSTFQHFTDIISYNTGQVLRYELNGNPLLYSSKDKISSLFYDSNGKLRPEPLLPTPGFNPGVQRRFELQLMPKAIIDLEANLENIMDGMEWGTVIVATDSDDIMPDHKFDENFVGYVEEWCGVQWEEEVKRT
ncbi:hypothetical protein CANARDRAFT_197026 [[Candida] arabinofermentans NRRL YB-2248]|uniref:Programmed cell death protein 2 C-terminal domain-containing protein n=1 Tax=[Candida] arabinofermentans NRRL YB-2248 TaxID=983967 RepID=A0A1E4T3R0_9ASCO|nr:hypothetical protein CANARDRAFT_197026 [[Candida] arabinofermentans NRRL YB-2248]